MSAYATSFKNSPSELTRIRRDLAKLNIIQYAILRIAGFAVFAWVASATDDDFFCPIQLYSALLFPPRISWGDSIGMVSIPFTGIVILAIHAAIRLHTESYWADYRGSISWSLSATGKFAVGQIVVGLVGAGFFFSSVDEHNAALSVHHIFDADVLRVVWITFGVGFVLYGVHRGEIGKWVVHPDVKEGHFVIRYLLLGK